MSNNKSDVSNKQLESEITDAVGNEVDLSADLEVLLSKVIEDHDFKNYTVNKRSMTTRGEGFMSRLHEIIVKEVAGEEKLELNFCVKCIYPGVDVLLFPLRGVFLREIFVYEELSKVYESLQTEAGVPLEDRYDFVKCFGVCKNEGSEALILENMTAKGYKTYSKNYNISLEFAKLSMIRLAKFHALSYALGRLRPDYYESRIRPLTTQYLFNDSWTQCVRNVAQATLDVFTPSDPRHQKMRDFVEKTIQKFPAYYEPSDRSVLCHGDYRPSNILMKEKDGILSGVLPVDYQIAQMCSPVIDLAYFFFAGTDRAFRSAHMTDLIHLYRETMRTFLARFGVDLEGVSPTPEFEREYRDKLDYGLMIGIVSLPCILVSPEHAPDLSSTSVTDIRIQGSSLFRQRIAEIVEDFESWGYL
ncbi:hypothetical protein EVAR_87264_1 [Eumeta japonica]|uniref:CHK kinase-like domain-containing protein n=1 Tax=Eumeta variegata TaxID=151549 RepID=A0A4C1VYJ2_EUMVA|nr:hypothetical protein EVAR_87264_1 [Eumeta japonica]